MTVEIKDGHIEICEGNRKFHMKNPISFIAKAKKRNWNEVGFYARRARTPSFVLRQLKYWKNLEDTEDGTLANVKALDGRKVKVTIEVMEK